MNILKMAVHVLILLVAMTMTNACDGGSSVPDGSEQSVINNDNETNTSAVHDELPTENEREESADSPVLEYLTYDVSDDISLSPLNNQDGVIQPGESIRLVVKIKNTGDVDTTGVRVALSSNTACAVVDPEFADLSYGDVAVHDIMAPQNGAAFRLEISSDCTLQATTGFSLLISDDADHEWTGAFDLPLHQDTDASLGFLTYVVDDDASYSNLNNGDGQAQPGESIRLTLKIKNTGTTDAIGVDVALQANSSCVTVNPEFSTFDYGDVLVDEITAASDGATYHLELGADCTVETPVSLMLLITDNNVGAWESVFELPLTHEGGANLIFVSHTLHDSASYSSANQEDGLAQPGESVRIGMTLRNTGSSMAKGVTAALTSNSACATVSPAHGEIHYGDIGAGETVSSDASNQFHVELSSDCQGGMLLDFTVTASDNHLGEWLDYFNVEVATPVVVEETPILETIYCDSDSDCAAQELCTDGLCQVDRCPGYYTSDAPMGEAIYLAFEREFVMMDTKTTSGAYWLDVHDVNADSSDGFSYEFAFDAAGEKPMDIAGGNLFGIRPEAVVTIYDGVSDIRVMHEADSFEMHAGLIPIAIDVGDVWGNGTEVLVVASSSGAYAVCNAVTEDCESGQAPTGYTYLDLAVGDVDADNRDELVFVAESGTGKIHILIENIDAGQTGQQVNYIQVVEDKEPKRLTVGDVDGDGRHEIIAFSEGGWLSFADDHLRTFTLNEEGEIIDHGYQGTTDNEYMDLVAGDTDGDGVYEIALLLDDNKMLLFEASEELGSYTWSDKVDLAPGNDIDRLTMADVNGDSAIGALTEGPELMPAAVVPIAVLHLPPYDAEYSGGKSRVSYGVTEGEGQTTGNSLSLSLKADVGWAGGIPFALKASLTLAFAKTTTFSQSTSTKYNVKTGYNLSADTEKYGEQYAGVVLAWGCYHGYEYRVDDPQALLPDQADDVEYMITVPVGGGSTLWSSDRYNTLAALSEDLPQVDVPHVLGDPMSYPSEILAVDGSTISADDMVFPDTNSYTVSDVGSVSWGYTVSEFTTNGVSLNTSVTASAKLTAGGYSFGTGVTSGDTDIYRLTVGTSTTFSGILPAVPDDPSTATDEFLLYSHSVEPYVYRSTYPTSGGGTSGFYVVYYAVP